MGASLTFAPAEKKPVARASLSLLHPHLTPHDRAFAHGTGTLDENKLLPRSPNGRRLSENVPPIVREVLSSPGQALNPGTRSLMEARLGHDLSRVRVHADARAAESARAVNALAYTVGQHIAFGAVDYLPASSRGQRLLAHELTHAVQQSGGRTGTAGIGVATPNHAAEQEAENVSRSVTAGSRVNFISSTPVRIARQSIGPNVTLNPFEDLENPYRSPGEEQAEEFRRTTISVVRDPILAALRRGDAITFLNRLRELDADDRAQLESDVSFMNEVHRFLRGMSYWIVQLILRFGSRRAIYVRQLLLAVTDRNIQLIADLLRTYRELRDPTVVPGVREMLDYELRGVREHDAVLAIVDAAEVGARTGVRGRFQEAHYERPKGGGAYQIQSFTGTTDFSLARTGSELRVLVRIHLVEAANVTQTFYPDDRTASEWRRGIESAWNNRFIATNGTTRLRVIFVPLFTEELPNHTVQIDHGTGRSDEHKWYLQSVNGQIIAHEFGHMVGNPDEYRLPATSAEIPVSFGLLAQETQRSTVQGIKPGAPPPAARAGGYSQEGIMGQKGAQVALPRHAGAVMDLLNQNLLQPGEAPFHLE